MGISDLARSLHHLYITNYAVNNMNYQSFTSLNSLKDTVPSPFLSKPDEWKERNCGFDTDTEVLQSKLITPKRR